MELAKKCKPVLLREYSNVSTVTSFAVFFRDGINVALSTY